MSILYDVSYCLVSDVDKLIIMKLVVLLSLSILFLSHCQGDLIFVPPDFPEKLCVVGIIDADDTTRAIIFEKSYQSSYIGEISDSLRGLHFSLSTETERIIDYKFTSVQPRITKWIMPDDVLFESNTKYSLHAIEQGAGEIFSELVVPSPPIEFSAQHVGSVNSFLPHPFECYNPISSALINVRFKPSSNYYYMLMVDNTYIHYGKATNTYVGYSVIESNCISFSTTLSPEFKRQELYECFRSRPLIIPTTQCEFNFFDTQKLEGSECIFTIKIDIHQDLFDSSRPIRIRLSSIPEELYDYQKSIHTFRSSSLDPFSEPVFLKGNIIGGYGIFAIYRSTQISLSLQ